MLACGYPRQGAETLLRHSTALTCQYCRETGAVHRIGWNNFRPRVEYYRCWACHNVWATDASGEVMRVIRATDRPGPLQASEPRALSDLGS